MDLDRINKKITALQNRNSVGYASVAGNVEAFSKNGTTLTIRKDGTMNCNNIFTADNIKPDNERRLRALEIEVDTIDDKFTSKDEEHDEKIADLEEKDVTHEERMDVIEEDIDNLKAKDEEHDSRLNAIEEDIDALEEKDIAHETRMNDIEEDITGHNDRIEVLEEKAEEQASLIEGANETAQEHEERIDTIERQITFLEDTNNN